MAQSENSDINECIKIMIADDHELVREVIKLLFNRKRDLQIVYEARNGKEAIDIYETAKPDIVLMDIKMPVMNGIEATNIITSKYKDSKIVMFTENDSIHTIIASLSSGARGFCQKTTSAEHLIEGLRLVYGGDIWLCSAVSKTYARELKNIHSKSKNKNLIKTMHDRFPFLNEQITFTINCQPQPQKEDKIQRD